MNGNPITILYTQDAHLARRAKAYLKSTAKVRHVSEPDRLEAVLQQSSPAVVVMDLRARDGRDLIGHLQNAWPDSLVIALGVPRSEPLRDAENSDLYAAEDVELDRRRFQALLHRAFDYLQLQQQKRDLEDGRTVAMAPPPSPVARHDFTPEPPAPLLRFSRMLRRFDNVEALLASLAENIAEVAGVTRVGIFSRIRQGDRYQLRAAVRCLPETKELDFGERDPLVRWFETNAHLIARANLPYVVESSQRNLLRRSLDTFGAEVIVPLHARGRVIGWMFFGHRLTGQPFDYAGLEGLMALAEHVSTMLDNALLYEEVTLQKTLAETLLKSIPPGIVAIDEEGLIRWFNPPAESILSVTAAEAIDRPVEAAGGKLAALLRETLATTENFPAQNWIDPRTRRSLSVETRRLVDQQTPLGAVAVIHDLTQEENLQQKQELVDRAAFWTDLAASMSHEIRNPLVAIKTFAQLLPERFDDPEFRQDFNRIVVQEVDRLDKIITQINSFAHPAELIMKPLDIGESVKRGVEIARAKLSVNGGVAIETELAPNLPPILGDENALAETFAHLVANAAEAMGEQKKPRITLSAKPLRERGRPSAVLVTVQDNGRGIVPELREKVFSPFCTTKARGIGLGLPIVKRTIYDHNGRLDIDSTTRGTAVNIALPVTEND